MRRTSSNAYLALFATAVLGSAAATTAQRQPSATWAHDGKHVVLGKTWFDPDTWAKVVPVAKPKSPAKKPLEQIREALRKARGKKVPKALLAGTSSRSTLPRAPVRYPGTRRTADNRGATTILGNELWVWNAGQPARRVSDGLAGVRHFQMAPNAKAVSFIRDFNLFVVRTADGETLQITDDGGENLFNGELDWVYQEEVYGRFNFKGTWWSPASDHVAYLRIEEQGVDTFSVVDHIPNQLEVDTLKYPKAGRTNPRATLHIAGTGDGKSIPVDLTKYPLKDEILIVRVGWTPEGDRAVFLVQNREQTWMDLNFADPATGAIETVLRENCDDGWVNILAMPRWLDDGTFLWESERTGFKHLYRYRRDGSLVATVSKGEWEVRRIIRLDQERGWIAFYGTTPEYAIGNNAYRATLDGKSLVRLTHGRGNHSISFNADGTRLIDKFSSMANPGEEWLRTADGSEGRQLSDRKVPKGVVPPQWKQIRARDGEVLDIAYTLPTGFDESKSYPVWISTYSGPDSPSVRDSWRRGRPSDWYIGLQINVRSASGRGMKYTKACYRQFGVPELRDIEDAVDWICKHPWADASRVGITGWSYGGFMAAFALTHSKKFKCGIAGAGVYDWALYDTIYTERYMATPQNNPKGYAGTSVIEAAKNLTGELLIVHGTMDDNVHMQNAIQFVHALQEAGKQNFTFMPYAKSRHGVRSRHLGGLRSKFMREHL